MASAELLERLRAGLDKTFARMAEEDGVTLEYIDGKVAEALARGEMLKRQVRESGSATDDTRSHS